MFKYLFSVILAVITVVCSSSCYATSQQPLYGTVIVVDAGHGIFSQSRKEAVAPDSSETKAAFVSGTAGRFQTEEQLNLSLALKLEQKLTQLGARVYMTRTTHECNMSNIDRAVLGNSIFADLSVRIHADGSSSSQPHGMSMLVPSTNYFGDAAVCDKSFAAGSLILQEAIAATGAASRGIVRRSDLTGFNWSSIASVLIETGFMSNPSEDALLATDAYQQKIVDGIANGIIRYFVG